LAPDEHHPLPAGPWSEKCVSRQRHPATVTCHGRCGSVPPEDRHVMSPHVNLERTSPLRPRCTVQNRPLLHFQHHLRPSGYPIHLFRPLERRPRTCTFFRWDVGRNDARSARASCIELVAGLVRHQLERMICRPAAARFWLAAYRSHMSDCLGSVCRSVWSAPAGARYGSLAGRLDCESPGKVWRG
jgi:hypothetical protein